MPVSPAAIPAPDRAPRCTCPRPAGPRHIPYANPFASRLASTATQVAADVGADLIYAFYLEPYGVAARLASAWTGVRCQGCATPAVTFRNSPGTRRC